MKKNSWLSENSAQVLLDSLQDAIFVIEDSILVYVNRGLAEMLGESPEKLLGHHFIEFIAPRDRDIVLERHYARLAGKKVPNHYDMHLLTVRGKEIPCSMNVGLGKNEAGVTVTVGSIRDMTQHRAVLAELERSKADLKSIFDMLPDALYRADIHGTITMASPSCFDLLGYQPEEVLGTSMGDYYESPEERMRVVQAIVEGAGKAVQVVARMRHKNGTTIWVASNAMLRYDADGEPAFIEGLGRNVDEQKRMEEQLLSLSRMDTLTGTCNRRFFIERAEEVISMMQRYQRPASLIIADLDHFKSINDNFGHQAGDLSLKAFVEACRKEIRKSDILGRLGGEEFALMLPETSLEEARNLAERICNAVRGLNIQFANQVIKITVSIGLVELAANEATTIDDAMHRADLAMYQAKTHGRNRVVCLDK